MRFPLLIPFRLLLAFALPALALAACGDAAEVTAPAGNVTIAVTPSGTVELGIGDTITLNAAVANAATPTVTYTTSDSTVAVVGGDGLVRGVRPGSTTITVASVQDPGARVGVLVRVVDASTIPATDRQPTVVLESVVDPANRLVGSRPVQGTVFVRVNVERGRAQRLQVLVGSTIACQQALGTATPAPAAAARPLLGLAQVTLVCPIETARYNPNTGEPTFPNGTYVVSARLLGATDSVLANAGGLPLTLANPSTIVATLRTTRQAVGGGALAWRDGDLTVHALPVSYDAGQLPARVSFTYPRSQGGTITLTDTEAPFEVTFREAVELAGVSDDSLRITVTSATTGGEPGPSGFTELIRYDNRAPAPGTLAAREWVGAVDFASLYDRSGERDTGVGNVTLRFFAGNPGLGADELVTGGQEVTRGADLAEARPGSYRLAARVCDALENCATVEGFTFGVDLGAPTVTAVNLADRVANPDEGLTLALLDNLSGPESLEVSVSVLDADPSTSACGPTIEGQDLPGREAAGGCVRDTLLAASTLFVPRATAGYYTYSVTPLDRAGNRGTTVRRDILVDRLPPTVALGALPASLPSGESVALTAEAEDNLDLAAVSFRLVYPLPDGGSLSLPFAAAHAVGAPFDGRLDGARRTVAASPFPFVRTLTYAGTTSNSGGRVTVLADSIQARATDAAGQSAVSGRPIPAGALADTRVQDPFTTLAAIVPAVDNPRLCAAGCVPTDLDSTQVTVRVTGATSSAAAPFARLHLYRQAPDGTVFWLGSVAETSKLDTGTQTSWTYRYTYRPPLGLEGQHLLFAVGVGSTGNGLRSEAVPVTFYRR